MVIYMKTHNKIKITTAFISLAIAQHAAASGYHFGTQSVGAQSTANAAAAEAADASTLFYNPAGLTHLDGKAEITGAINIVAPALKYHDAQASYYQGGNVQGATSGKITKTTAAPHVYGAYKLNDRVTLGMGMYIPFGSKTDYQDDSVLRYNIKKLGLTSIALEPAVAFKFNEKHSFAVGLIAQYSEAELTKYADWSAARDNRTLAATAAALQRMGIPAAATANRANWQGRGDVKGHDWGFGYHLGWMFDVNDKFRLGVAHRSKVSHNLKGTAKWQPAGAVVQVPAIANYIRHRIGRRARLPAQRRRIGAHHHARIALAARHVSRQRQAQPVWRHHLDAPQPLQQSRPCVRQHQKRGKRAIQPHHHHAQLAQHLQNRARRRVSIQRTLTAARGHRL